jgi:hypothetical protein
MNVPTHPNPKSAPLAIVRDVREVLANIAYRENWEQCPSTHCERGHECMSPRECSGTGRGPARRILPAISALESNLAAREAGGKDGAEPSTEWLTIVSRSIGRTMGMENHTARAKDVFKSLRENNQEVPQPTRDFPVSSSPSLATAMREAAAKAVERLDECPQDLDSCDVMAWEQGNKDAAAIRALPLPAPGDEGKGRGEVERWKDAATRNAKNAIEDVAICRETIALLREENRLKETENEESRKEFETERDSLRAQVAELRKSLIEAAKLVENVAPKRHDISAVCVLAIGAIDAAKDPESKS